MKKPQLFLLHFAGGNRYSFQFMSPYLKDFEIIPLELPGRGRRMEEGLLMDFDMAACDFYRQILEKLTGTDFLIYGHSMGAYLALRVSNMLEKAGKYPACLFVSGNAGPGVRESKNRYLLGHDEFVEELKKLGGIPEEFIIEKELFNLFEPILRADFQIAEKNQIKEESATRSPLFAMMGTQEENVEHIQEWAKYTKAGFDCEVLEGDHFFIHKHPDRIAYLIKYNYVKVASLQDH